MGSSANERLGLILELYRLVGSTLNADIAEAQTDETADALRTNLQSLRMAFRRAQQVDLDAEGAKVEAAYSMARAAADAVQYSFAAGQALHSRIVVVGNAVRAIEHLLDVAGDDDGYGGPRLQ